MFKQNVGSVDRLIRVVVGLALLGYFAFSAGSMRWLGLIGIVPILTATVSFCPLYAMLGLSTRPGNRTT